MSAKDTLKGSVSGPFLFIVNPNSGTGSVDHFGQAIAPFKDGPKHEVVISENGQHSIDLARNARSNGFGAVVAVGGDGSVNEIGRQLIGTGMPLGIVPTGSGNGIARHFGISNKLSTAVKQAFRGNIKTIDTIRINDLSAVGFCGVGLDGFIARAFNQNSSERGFSNYVKLTIDIFGSYQPLTYSVEMNGQSEEVKAYSIVVANARQFGNNAYINPTGNESDGQLELIVIKNFPKAAFAPMAAMLFLQNIHKSKHVETHRITRARVKNPQCEAVQLDGEFLGTPDELDIEINPASLNILVP